MLAPALGLTCGRHIDTDRLDLDHGWLNLNELGRDRDAGKGGGVETRVHDDELRVDGDTCGTLAEEARPAAHARGNWTIARMNQDVICKGSTCTGCAYMHSSFVQMHAAVWS